jgi:hypothetical protein
MEPLFSILITADTPTNGLLLYARICDCANLAAQGDIVVASDRTAEFARRSAS